MSLNVRHIIRKIIKKLYISYVAGWVKYHRHISKKQDKKQRSYGFVNNYEFSILVPLYNTPEPYLVDMIESVIRQTYGNWQLCLADGSDNAHGNVKEICEKYAGMDGRIQYRKLDENRGIAENTNICISMASGEYIGLFDHDDLLHPSALFEMMKVIETEKADFIYTDEAAFGTREWHLQSVHKKPEFSMVRLRGNNYICHFTVFKKELLKKSGCFRKEYDGSQDHDLIFRLCENAKKIYHISKVLYFWRAHSESVAMTIENKPYAVEAGIRAVSSHLERQGISGWVEPVKKAIPFYNVWYDVDFDVTQVEVLYEKSRQIDELLEKRNKEFVLLVTEDLALPEKKDIKQMLMYLADPKVKAVTGVVVDRKNRIVSAGIECKKKKNGRICIYHKYAKEPYGITGEMMQMTYAGGIPVICNGCMLLRRGDLEYVKKEKWFDMAQWVILSQKWRDEGFELILDPRIVLYYQKSKKERKR